MVWYSSRRCCRFHFHGSSEIGLQSLCIGRQTVSSSRCLSVVGCILIDLLSLMSLLIRYPSFSMYGAYQIELRELSSWPLGQSHKWTSQQFLGVSSITWSVFRCVRDNALTSRFVSSMVFKFYIACSYYLFCTASIALGADPTDRSILSFRLESWCFHILICCLIEFNSSFRIF
jgi:hypothetical protein